MMDLKTAVKYLRESIGESQQAFATRLQMSIRAIANYEKDRAPTGKALAQLMKLADEYGHADLAELFQNALSAELGYPVRRLRRPTASEDPMPGEAATIEHPDVARIDGLLATRAWRSPLVKCGTREEIDAALVKGNPDG